MTRLFEVPDDFADDAVAGFADVYSATIRQVPGGVVLRRLPKANEVALVVGGGSGHYPAFGGWVGEGLAHGAVIGNVFTSPSAADAFSVGQAVAQRGGLLMCTGNYTGDVLNFTLARQQLEEAGIETRVVFVTDDVASAGSDEHERRRGIAGALVVAKVAGAAAAAGRSLDEVERVARHANSRTRSFGVAFAGCTLPGATQPLFAVRPGTMAVGLGIHGEPGIAETPLPGARELAGRLVDRVLEEAPDDSRRVAVLLNGLGATKYEELFVMWRHLAKTLRARGYSVVGPEVGELVTSLDMAGCSLTLTFLDETLERYWLAPASTPAFRRRDGGRHLEQAALSEAQGNSAPLARGATTRSPTPHERSATKVRPSSAASRRAANTALICLRDMQASVAGIAEELGRIDALAGDGDHGRGMLKGLAAAVDAATGAVASETGVSELLSKAGKAWSRRAGGTSGVLWGAALEAAGAGLERADAADVTRGDVVEAIHAAGAAIAELGGARVGDKTMLDALVPFSEALRDSVASGLDLGAAWLHAAEISTRAARNTADLTPKVGRARVIPERSLGTPDAGALSMAACLMAATAAIQSRCAYDPAARH